jgi:hypothetical protein
VRTPATGLCGLRAKLLYRTTPADVEAARKGRDSYEIEFAEFTGTVLRDMDRLIGDKWIHGAVG